jgi:hypothetical protein
MRRVALSILAVAAALSGILAAIGPSAGAQGLIDLSATSVSSPAAVSPPGGLVIYTATFRNEGALAIAGVFTNTTVGGTILSVDADDTCGTTGNTVTCRDTLAAGASKVVELIVQTPLTAGSTVTNTSTAAVDPGLVSVLDLYPENDTSTVVTAVQATTGVGSAAFVPEGGTLAYKKHLLTVREAELGVVAFLQDTPTVTNLDCGGQPCQEGLRVDFDQDPRFAGLVDVDVNFGISDPCRGLGAEKCRPLFYFKPEMAAPAPIGLCGIASPDVPCLESTYKDGNQFHFVVVMTTDDPDLLTPVKSLVSPTSG